MHMLYFGTVRTLFVLACLLICSSVGAESKTKIGVSVPLTGPNATFGTDIRNVVLFANRKLAQETYEIIVENDNCDGKGAVTVAHKLVDIDKVSAVFLGCDTVGMASAPVYRAKGVLVFAPIVTTPRFSQLGKTFFRLSPNDADNARILVEYISKKHKRLGMLTEESSEYCEDLAREITHQAKSQGLQVINEHMVAGSDDFKTILLKLRNQGIDALLVNPNSEAPFLTVLRQLDQLHIQLPIFGAYAPGSSTFQREAGPLANGIVFTDFPLLSEIQKKENSLLDEYKAAYGPLNAWDYTFGTTLESFRIMHAALQQKDNPANYIHTTAFPGILGEIRFNPQGDVIGIRHHLRTIHDGSVISLNE